MPAEVALAGESSLDGDLNGGDALGEQGFGASDAELDLVEMWGETDFGAEEMIEVERTEAGELGEDRTFHYSI